jgi:hypothetical protein
MIETELRFFEMNEEFFLPDSAKFRAHEEPDLFSIVE